MGESFWVHRFWTLAFVAGPAAAVVAAVAAFYQESAVVKLAAAVLVKIAFWAIVFPWIYAIPLGFVAVFIVFLPNFFLQCVGLKKAPQKLSGGIWTIHGKQYDFSAWVDYHPGGRLAIDLGRNRDCTGLFESYHTFANQSYLQKTLARYELPATKLALDPSNSAKDASANKNDPCEAVSSTNLDFSCPFREDVKKLVKEHFKHKSRTIKPGVAFLAMVMLVIQLWLMWRFLHGCWFATIVTPAVSWFLVANVTHDASHFAVSRRPWVNRMCTFLAVPFYYGPSAWNVQHVVQHHVYTNDASDVDLYHFLPVARCSKLTEYMSVFRWQSWTVFMVLVTTVMHLQIIVPQDLLTGQIDAITGERRYGQCENIADFVARSRRSILAELLLSASWPLLNIYLNGLGCWWQLTLSYSISSYIFVMITQGAHLNADSQQAVADQSWGKKQVSTSVNFHPTSRFWWLASGGLNMQSLHHLVPDIGSSHLMDLWPKFSDICIKHNVELKVSGGILPFFGGFRNWIGELSRNDVAD